MSKIKIQGQSSGSGVYTLKTGTSSSNFDLTLPDVTGTIISANSAGNVGIGVVPESWDSQFTVLNVGTGGTLAGGTDGDYFASGANWYQTGGVDKYVTSSKYSSLYTQNNGKHTFQVAPSGTADTAISFTNAMTINNSGQVLVGATATPNDFKMYIEGDAANPKVLYSKVPGSGDVSHFYFVNPNGPVGSIGTNGSATSYYTSSDYRLKENVVPMTGSIDRLKALNPSRFNFIADADTTVDGFLAHEAQEVVPEAITGTKDAMKTEEYEVTPAIEEVKDEEGNITTEAVEAVMGEREVEDYQGIDQSKLVPLLVASLQEAIARIEELTTRIETLEVI
jgi:hypothetical protein